MRIIDADEVVKFYKNMGKEFPELSAGVHFSINDIINNLDNIDTVKNVHFGGKTAMTKYSDIEIQTANNLLKEGYKWIARETFGWLYAYKDEPHKDYDRNINDYVWRDNGKYCPVCTIRAPIFLNVTCCDKEPVSLESIVHPQILDDVERKYLSAVIKPFRNKVKSINKAASEANQEFIAIDFKNGDETFLPWFKAGTMYKGMKLGRKYTLEELGL